MKHIQEHTLKLKHCAHSFRPWFAISLFAVCKNLSLSSITKITTKVGEKFLCISASSFLLFLSFFLAFFYLPYSHDFSTVHQTNERECVCLHFPSSIHLALNFMAIEKKSAIQKECFFFAGLNSRDTYRASRRMYTTFLWSYVCRLFNKCCCHFFFSIQNKWKRFIFNV